MKSRMLYLAVFLFLFSQVCFALEADEILIIANKDNPASIRIAEYYCQKRGVPEKNILKLAMPAALFDAIKRTDYDEMIAKPILEKLSSAPFDTKIKCLLTTYGIPYKVGARTPDINGQKHLDKLKKLGDSRTALVNNILAELKTIGKTPGTEVKPQAKLKSQKLVQAVTKESSAALKRIDSLGDSDEKKKLYEKWTGLYSILFGKIQASKIAQANSNLEVDFSYADQTRLSGHDSTVRAGISENWDIKQRLKQKFYKSYEQVKGIAAVVLLIGNDIDSIRGVQTSASVDSELSMLRFGDYQLYRWQPNELKQRVFWFDVKTLMVARLDGPDENIAMSIIDSSIAAEAKGLRGTVYIDSGWNKGKGGMYEQYDQHLKKTAQLFRDRTDFKVVEEETAKLFAAGACPDAAVYCGWYSLAKYVDAFDFVPGAVGFHIASYEAVHLRKPGSAEWVPAMLRDGIAATLGPVEEPYLHTFPIPHLFFGELLDGKTLVEAYYRTNPANSWQQLLIGDPLYRPFKNVKVK